MELEALAVVWAINDILHYLFGRPFMVLTDHHLLSYLQQMKNLCNRMARWIMKLLKCDYTVVFKFKKTQLELDCLSWNRTNILP